MDRGGIWSHRGSIAGVLVISCRRVVRNNFWDVNGRVSGRRNAKVKGNHISAQGNLCRTGDGSRLTQTFCEAPLSLDESTTQLLTWRVTCTWKVQSCQSRTVRCICMVVVPGIFTHPSTRARAQDFRWASGSSMMFHGHGTNVCSAAYCGFEARTAWGLGTQLLNAQSRDLRDGHVDPFAGLQVWYYHATSDLTHGQLTFRPGSSWAPEMWALRWGIIFLDTKNQSKREQSTNDPSPDGMLSQGKQDAFWRWTGSIFSASRPVFFEAVWLEPSAGALFSVKWLSKTDKNSGLCCPKNFEYTYTGSYTIVFLHYQATSHGQTDPCTETLTETSISGWGSPQQLELHSRWSRRKSTPRMAVSTPWRSWNSTMLASTKNRWEGVTSDQRIYRWSIEVHLLLVRHAEIQSFDIPSV